MAQLKDLLVSGAARFLNGLNVNGDLTIAGNLLPAKNETYNLGDSSHRWRQTQTKYLSVGAGDISSSGYEAVISGDFHTTGYSLFDDYVQVGGARDSAAYKFYVNGKTHLKGDTRITGNLLMTTGNTAIYWDDGTYRQRIINTDDSTANTAVFNFQQSENSGSSWKNLLEIRDNGLLILTQNSGGIYKQFSTVDQQPMIYMRAGDIDNYLFEISDNTITTTHGHTYGFGLKYIGSGSGENNALDLIADNMGGTDIIALSISNNGKVGIGDKFNTNYRLYVNGNSYLKGNVNIKGDLYLLYDSADQYLQHTLEGTVASHAAKLSLYRVAASGTSGKVGTRTRGILLDASTGFIELNSVASNPSATAGARIAFKYDGGQPVYLSYTPNDSYRAPYGLKIWGSDGSAPGAWLEVEGNLYIGSASNSNSNNNAALYIRNMSAIEGYDNWLRLNDNSSFTGGTYSPKLIRSDEALQVGSSGANFYANTTRTFVQTHLGVGAVNDSYNFYVSGISYHSNTVNFAENTTAINFRPGNTNYYTTLSYQTTGNEALVFAAKSSVTSFMFVSGEDSIANHASDRWTKLSPTLQIKNKSVYVNSLIGNGVTPSYNFYVNGTSYFNGNVTHNGIDYFANGTTYYINNSADAKLRYLALGGLDPTSSYQLYVNGTSWIKGVLWTRDLYPEANNTYALGHPSYYWKNLYLNKSIKQSSRFYPIVGSAAGSVWYKITFPWAGQVRDNNAWFMTSMDIVVGGPYSNGSSGTIHLAYYFSYNGTNHTYGATNVYGSAIGTRMTNIIIKYDIANPGIMYVKASSNRYCGIAINNLMAHDTAPGYDFINTTIQAIAEADIPAEVNKVVPLTLFNSDNGASNGTFYVLKSGDTMTGNLTAPNFIGSLQGNATSANKLNTNAGSTGQPVYFGNGQPIAIDWHIGNSGVGEHNANSVTYNFCGYYTSNGPATSLGASTTDGALYAQAYNSSWVGQIAQDYRNGGLYVRGKNNGTWQSWYSVLDTRNYSSILDSRYVNATGDTITGELYVDGGTTLASLLVKGDARFVNTIQGNLSGNASTATKLANARTISLTGSVTGSGTFDGSGNLSISTTANHNHDSNYVKKSGDTMTGHLNNNSEFITTSFNGLRISAASSTSTKSMLLRNDGSDFYILCCNSASAGDNWYIPTGGAHPFRINLTTGYSYFSRAYGAVWNDYAEYRSTSEVQPGKCVVETGLGNLIQSTKRLQPGANIVSDTFGFAIGETEQTKTPIAVSGRVLAYPNEDRYSYSAGDPVCSGPNGTISKMTREEIREYSDRIVGTVSEIPDYETWGTGKVKVDGRIWIKVR